MIGVIGVIGVDGVSGYFATMAGGELTAKSQKICHGPRALVFSAINQRQGCIELCAICQRTVDH